jgi:serine/threonine protein phosphatase 1
VSRTFAIGDIHGDLAALETLLPRLPLEEDDHVVFIGDYVDRGPDSRGVIARVRALAAERPGRVFCLRGNHEDKWIDCYREPDPGFLLPPGNGCAATYRSFVDAPARATEDGFAPDELAALADVAAWLPADVHAWMETLLLWHEDEHAIYVHAGLDGEGEAWKHPRDSRDKPLMWMREPDFFQQYQGKRVVFGHTPTSALPTDHLGTLRKLFDDPKDVWVRGDLVGIDTGCGKGGFLSAIELPRGKVYESR